MVDVLDESAALLAKDKPWFFAEEDSVWLASGNYPGDIGTFQRCWAMVVPEYATGGTTCHRSGPRTSRTPSSTSWYPVRCDGCGKFRSASDLVRRPVTQADYLFGDPGPYYDCTGCISADSRPIEAETAGDRGYFYFEAE